jgi:flagellar hook-length control protein FliK
MFNGMAQTAAFPLGLIIGSGGHSSAAARGTPGAPGGFDNLLGLFGMAGSPQGVPPNGGLPEVSGVFTMGNTETASEMTVPVLLPLDLAQALGVSTQANPETMNSMPATDTGEPLVAARAVITPGPDAHGDVIALTFSTSDGADTALADQAAGETDKDAMILPIRLRTVEQQGGRLVADAKLLTATGKDVSLRITIDPTLKNDQMGMMDTGSENTAAAGKSAGQQNLSALLKNLNATTMIIEQAPGERASALSSLTPRDLLLRGSSMRPLHLNGTATPNDTMGMAQMNQTVGASQVSNGVMPSAAMERLTDVMPAQASPDTQVNGGKMTQVSSNGSETALFGTTTATALDGGVPEAGSFEPRTSAVRFFNIDNKLAQLKHNPGQSIKVQLVPSHLGRMEVSIVNYRGLVTVNMMVESNQAKQAVERNLGQLERQFSAAGIRVDAMQLHVNQPFRNAGLGFQQQQFAQYYGQSNGHDSRGHNQGHSANGFASKGQFGQPDEGFARVMVNCLA